MNRTLAAIVIAGLAGTAAARPGPVRGGPVAGKPVAARKPQHDGAHARVAINRAGDLRPAREVVGRREQPLSPEEDTARQIEKLLRGPLRVGVTGLFVADAQTGEPLFAVNADDPLNPASNVKMISTATALELLGPDFRYPTRLLGATPDAGVVHGDVYLLGSYDPTLTVGDLDELAAAVAARGVTRIDGQIVVGADPTRDGVFRAAIPLEVHAGEPGAPPVVTAPPGLDLVSITVAARTGASPARPHLSYKAESTTDATGRPHLTVTVGGTIGKAGTSSYALPTRERTALAAYALRAALRGHGVALAGDYRIGELGDFIGAATAAGSLPIELARHDSPRLAEIIARVNKWSINWLADRVIMTAAALVKREPPTMELALAAMYDWLGRHPGIARDGLVVDTGSGLSYHTQITPHDLVAIVRSAAGYFPAPDDEVAHAWVDSLSVAGTDGTLSSRFRTPGLRGKLRGKTGTLSTAVALSGILDVDPARPLAFSIVTNGDTPLSTRYVRRAHEQLVGLLCHYLDTTRKPGDRGPAPAAPDLRRPPAPSRSERIELDELEPDTALDDETAAQP